MNMQKLTKPIIVDGQIIPEGSELYISDELLKSGERAFELAQVRNKIDVKAGDPGTREGIIADVLALTLEKFCDLIEKLSNAKTLEHVRDAALSHAVFAKSINQAIKDGSLEFPYRAKGISEDEVIHDLKRVSAGISASIKSV